MQDPVEIEAKPARRHRFRISIRAFMCLISVLAIWLGNVVHKAREQVRVVAAIRSHGGFICYDWEYGVGESRPAGRSPWAPAWLRRTAGADFFQRVVAVDVKSSIGADGKKVLNTEFTDGLIDEIAKLDGLRFLYIRNDQATDRAMAIIGRMTGLESLGISDAKVTQAGWAKLAGLRNLENLTILNSGLEDESLRHVGGLPKLKTLFMQQNPITNQGLYYLQGMTSLRQLLLELGEEDITDAGLVHLKGLTKLEHLGLQKIKFTDKALDALVGMVELKHLWFGTPSNVAPEAMAKLKAVLPKLKDVQ